MAEQVRVKKDYFDGLGRLDQTVVKEGSRLKKDLIQPYKYDNANRQVQLYLPYACNGESNGNYRSHWANEQSDFYNTAQFVPHDSRPFREVIYEKSPLNRVDKANGAGESWITELNERIGSETRYLLNSAAEIRLVSFNLSNGLLEYGDFLFRRCRYQNCNDR